ncbi:MAG: hypothetical protein MSH33_11615, partial [Fusobacterium necrophorum]|nr:hypothetical protein [Fusobacterium necrophorum]
YGMGKVQKKCMQRNLQHIYFSVTFTIAIYTKITFEKNNLEKITQQCYNFIIIKLYYGIREERYEESISTICYFDGGILCGLWEEARTGSGK